MPELYSNQVKLNAASQPRATAPKFDDSIGKALGNLGNTGMQIAENMAKLEDMELDARVKAKTTEALEALKLADEKDGNYEKAALQAKQTYLSAFDGASKGALNRFNRRHPDSDLLFDGASTALVFEKSNKTIYNRTLNNLNEWTTNVALGLMSHGEIDNIIDNMPSLTSDQKEDLKIKATNSIDEYDVMSNISRSTEKSLIAAGRILEKNKTMPLERKAYWAERINSAAASMYKKEEDKKGKQEQFVHDTIIDTYANIGKFKGYDQADIWLENVYRFVGTEKDSKAMLGISINTIDPDSEFYLPTMNMNKIYTDAHNNRPKSADVLNYEAKMNHDAANIVTHYENSKKNGSNIHLLQDSVTAQTVLDSGVLKEGKERDIVTEIALAPLDVVSAAVNDMDRTDITRFDAEYKTGYGTTYADYTPNAMLYNLALNDLPEDPAVVIGTARKSLDDNFLTNDLEQQPGTEAYNLTNAFVYLSALSKDPNFSSALGVGRISSHALNNSYIGLLRKMQFEGNYNEKANMDDSTDYLEELITASTGLPVTKEAKEKDVYKKIESDLFSADYFYLRHSNNKFRNEYRWWDRLVGGDTQKLPQLSSSSRNILYPRTEAKNKWSK